MLNAKQLEIISYLYENDGCVKADYLAKITDISTRTIKRYIDTINEELKKQEIEIVSVRGKGYQLKGSLKQIEKLMKKNNVQENHEKRLHQIILHLIAVDEITLDELAQKINYSVSTMNKLTNDIKEALKKYELDLVSRPYYGVHIEGEEVNIRSFMIDYGFYIRENQLYVELLNINKNEFAVMDQILLEKLKKNNIVIADRDIHNLLERIAVSASRCKMGRYISNIPSQKNLRTKNYCVVVEILAAIANALHIDFSESEYDYVSLYSGFIIYDFSPTTIDVKTDVHDFLIKNLEEISIISGNNFLEKEYIVNSLSTHLNLLLSRINQNVKVKNPLLQQIKSEYAMEMNYAIFLAKKIEETFHIRVSEDELGYLAMYFGAAGNYKKNRKRVVILCNYGLGTSQLIGEQIKQEFLELEVVGIYPIHYLELAETQDIDFIISTVNIENYHGDKQLIVIDNLLSKDFLEKIKIALHEKENHFSKLVSCFHPDVFFHIEADSSKQAIEKLGNLMIQRKFINEEIKQSVLERENISTTEVGHLVAIPHTLFTGAYRSIIGVGILKKPVRWGKERVQLIFMICFHTKDKVISSAFRHLYKIVKNIDTVTKLIESKTFEEFISWMKGERK